MTYDKMKYDKDGVIFTTDLTTGLTTEEVEKRKRLFPYKNDGVYKTMNIIVVVLCCVMFVVSSITQKRIFTPLNMAIMIGIPLGILLELYLWFVKVFRDGKEQYVPHSELVVGDLIHLSRWKRIPAVGVLAEGEVWLIFPGSRMPSIHRTSVNSECELVIAKNVGYHNYDPPYLKEGMEVSKGKGTMIVTHI